MTRPAACRPRRYARGFAYLWLLFFVAAMGASLAAGGVVWELRVRRDKEADLLSVGAQFRHALADYYRFSPQAAKVYPQRLEDLLEDRRGPTPRRHLRRIYPDPMTGKPDWGLMLADGRVVGVYSQARGTPIRRDGFTADEAGFADAQSYAGWRFAAAPTTLSAGGAPEVLPGQPAATGGAAGPRRAAPAPADGPGTPGNQDSAPAAPSRAGG